MPFLPDASLSELAIVVALAAISAVLGGVAGYGTGPLMPLVLVPMVGAEPVVPIIAISSMFTNTARLSAFRQALATAPGADRAFGGVADLRAGRLALHAAFRPWRRDW